MDGDDTRRMRSGQRLLVVACLVLVLAYVVGWLIFTLELPNELACGLLPLGLSGLVACRRGLSAILADSLVRSVLWGQAAVLAWNLCWLGVVLSYSGGGWTGDWYGHWQRCQFFLKRPDVNILFNGFDPLPSRPPLVNVVVADWLTMTRNTFANYQLAMTTLSSMAFLPAALLAVRAAQCVPRSSATRAIPLMAVFFMTNPMAVQNATFAWRKLPAAMFTLAFVEFFLPSRPWAGDGIRRHISPENDRHRTRPHARPARHRRGRQHLRHDRAAFPAVARPVADPATEPVGIRSRLVV